MMRGWLGWSGWALGLGLAGNSFAGTSIDYTPAVACTAVVAQHADAGADHAADCTPLTFTTNPPSSGRHYSNWTAYKTYASFVPHGFLVHSLEHGAVVIGYNCPMGCEDDVALVQAWIDAQPLDVSPCQGLKRKIILAPDPDLDMRWGAAAWAWTWKAPCPDTASLGKFFAEHYNKTLEAGVCFDGLDLSSTGWCPAAIPDRQGPSRRTSLRPRLTWHGAIFEGRNLAGRRTTP